MWIFGWTSDPGTGYWRLHLPLGELAKAGHDVKHSISGLTVSSPHEWRNALDPLRDPELRHQMGLADPVQACEHLVEDHAGD